MTVGEQVIRQIAKAAKMHTLGIKVLSCMRIKYRIRVLAETRIFRVFRSYENYLRFLCILCT